MKLTIASALHRCAAALFCISFLHTVTESAAPCTQQFLPGQTLDKAKSQLNAQLSIINVTVTNDVNKCAQICCENGTFIGSRSEKYIDEIKNTLKNTHEACQV